MIPPIFRNASCLACVQYLSITLAPPSPLFPPSHLLPIVHTIVHTAVAKEEKGLPSRHPHYLLPSLFVQSKVSSICFILCALPPSLQIALFCRSGKGNHREIILGSRRVLSLSPSLSLAWTALVRLFSQRALSRTTKKRKTKETSIACVVMLRCWWDRFLSTMVTNRVLKCPPPPHIRHRLFFRWPKKIVSSQSNLRFVCVNSLSHTHSPLIHECIFLFSIFWTLNSLVVGHLALCK